MTFKHRKKYLNLLITRCEVLCLGFTGVVIIGVKSAFDFSAEEGEG